MKRSSQATFVCVLLVSASVLLVRLGDTHSAGTQVRAQIVTETAHRASLSGRVMYGSAPVAGARVELRRADWRTNPDAVVASAVADANGHYAFANAPVGDWTVMGFFPDGEPDAGSFPPVILEAGQSVTDLTVQLQRQIMLDAPAFGALVDTAPTLPWTPVGDAARYRVWIVDAGTTELLVNQSVTEHRLTTSGLKPGRTYEWEISAYDSEENELATATRPMKVVE